jgi:ECF transporter S component (folate family)
MEKLKRIKEMYANSLKELFVTKNIVLCGLMAALAVVLSMTASVEVGPYIRIGFSGIPNRVIECLFGPVAGCLFGGALDILKYMLKPSGPFFFGFTFNVMLAGVIYGSILYKKTVSIKRIIVAELLIKILVNCILNTLWISMLYGKGFFALLPLRVLKNAIMLPIDSAILYFALIYVKKLVNKIGFEDTRRVPTQL